MMVGRRTDSRLRTMLVVLYAFGVLATQHVFAQKPTKVPGALPTPSPSANAPRSIEQELAPLLIARVANDLKGEPDKPAAALIQAQAADALWKFDESQARSIFRLAFDTVRQQIPETSNLDKEERARHLDLLRRQASALKEIIRMFGRYDRLAAEQWLESVNEEEVKRDSSSTQLSQERAEFLAQLALQEVNANPREAQKLGLLSLAGKEIPSAFGPLMIALSEVDKTVSDVLFRAAIAALLRNNSPNGLILSSLSNYLFFSDGRIFNKTDAPNVRLFTDYLIEAANSQVSILREIRGGGGTMSGAGVSLVNFLAVRGMTIIGNNASEKLPILLPLFNELSNGLSPQQLSDMTMMSKSLRQQNLMDAASGGDLETLIDRAEHEKDQRVRDYLWRMLAIGAMRGDPERALKFAARIDDESMRAQTQDDINLVVIGDSVRSAAYRDAREAALKFNDPNLRAKALAEIADRAWLISKDRELAAELLSEAFTVATKGEATPDRVAITLLLAQKFAKFDQNRGFEMLTAAIKTINVIQSGPATQIQQTQHHGARIISYTMVGGAELSTEDHGTLDSLTFGALAPLACSDYYRARNLGDEIQNKLVRARYLIALARGVLGVPDPGKAQSGSQLPWR